MTDPKQLANTILSRATALFDGHCDPNGLIEPGSYTEGWEGLLVGYRMDSDGVADLHIFEPRKTREWTKMMLVFSARWSAGRPCRVERWRHGPWEGRFIREDA